VKRVPKLLLSTGLILSLSTVGISAASAAVAAPISISAPAKASVAIPAKAAAKAPAKVTINHLKNAKVNTKTTRYKVKPSYKKAKGVSVTSAKLHSVNNKGKALTKSASSMSLKPGTYKLKTTLKYNYKVSSKKVYKTATKIQTYKVSVHTPKVDVHYKGAGASVYSGKTYKLTPASYKKTGVPAVTSTNVSVMQGSKKIATNVKSVNLKPGTYKMTTRVNYKYNVGKKVVKKTAVRTQNFKVSVKAAPAPKVDIYYKGAGVTVDAGKTYKLTPSSYKKTGTSTVTSTHVTVTQGSKKIATNAKSVNLKPGAYKMTTRVNFKYNVGKKVIYKNTIRTQNFTVTAKKIVVAPKPDNSVTVTGAYTKDANTAKNIINSMRAKKGLPAYKSNAMFDTAVVNHVKSYNSNAKAPSETVPNSKIMSMGGMSGAYVGYSVSDWFEMEVGKMYEEDIYSKKYTHMAVATHVGQGYTWISVTYGSLR
jgi:hypothetical protein